MRLYDEIKLSGLYRTLNLMESDSRHGVLTLAENFERATVIVVDNVTQYYYVDNPKEVWDDDDFPNIAPPFDVYFMETKRPTHVVTDKSGQPVCYEWSSLGRPLRWGALFVPIPLKKGDMEDRFKGRGDRILKEFETAMASASSSSEKRSMLVTKQAIDCLRAVSAVGGWAVDISLFIQWPSGETEHAWTWMIAVDSDGHLMDGLPYIDTDSFYRPRDGGPSFSYVSEPFGKLGQTVAQLLQTHDVQVEDVKKQIDHAHKLVDELEKIAPKASREKFDALEASTKEKIQKLQDALENHKVVMEGTRRAMEMIRPSDVATEAVGYIKPFLIGLSLLHCKNVERILNTEPLALRKAREKRGKPPTSRYYTLRIDPKKTPGQTCTTKSGGTSSSPSFHLRRGHFVHYGMPGPDGVMRGKAFGKISGRFFIPMLRVGTKERGVVAKDYEVLELKKESGV